MDENVALQVAVDILIIELGKMDLARTIGIGFPELVAGDEAAYLEDVTRWRAGESLDIDEQPKKWIFSGLFMGVLCDVTVSRVTGHVLDVNLSLHE